MEITAACIASIHYTLTDDEGCALIAGRLGVAPAELPPECTAIVRRLGGHPLAISIAASIPTSCAGRISRRACWNGCTAAPTARTPSTTWT